MNSNRERAKETDERLLLLGSTGFVGAHLKRSLGRAYRLTTLVRGRRWDGRSASLPALVRHAAPRYIVNAAAVASISACDEDPELAQEVNAQLPRVLAETARDITARLIHLSTDQVFDGARGRYRERDLPSPITAYGKSKLEGERQALAVEGDTLVLRLNLLYGTSVGARPSSSDRLIARAREGRELPLFTDEFRSPLSVTDAASAVTELLPTQATGVLHLGGPERLSRFELGRAILAWAGLGDRAKASSAREHMGPPRAPDTSFDSSLASSLLRHPPRPLSVAVRDC